jgi:hypothetical protein
MKTFMHTRLKYSDSEWTYSVDDDDIYLDKL